MIELRPFERVSATQIGNYQSCKRLWWFQYVLGLKTKQKATAALGEMVHSFLERYLTDGTLPDPAHPAGQVANLGLHLLPKPRTVAVELNMKEHPANDLRFAGDIAVSGKVDVVIPTVPVPEVADHKTSGNLAYAKTAQDLLTDPQIIIYCAFVLKLMEFVGFPRSDVTGIKGTHIVYPTKGRFTTAIKTSTDVMSRDHVLGEWESIDVTVREMKKTALLTKPGDVEPTLKSCSKYGGCDFLKKCEALNRLPGTAPPRSLFHDPKNRQGENVGTVEELLARVKAESGGATTATPADATADLLKRLGGATAAAQVVPNDAPPDATVSAVAQVLGKAAAAAPAAPAEDKKTRKPKNYQTRLPALGWTEAQIGLMTAETMRHVLDNEVAATGYSVLPNGSLYNTAAAAAPTMADVAAADAAAAGGSATAAPLASEDGETVDIYDGIETEEVADDVWTVKINGEALKNAKGKNASFGSSDSASAAGRAEIDTRIAIIAAKAEADAKALAAAKAESAAAGARSASTPVAEAEGDIILYIDCIPIKGPDAVGYRFLDEILAPYMKLVAADQKVAHYSMVEYGRGPSFMAAFMMQEPPSGVIICSTRFPATNACLEVLQPMAKRIVKAW